jgi:hypothetical protein
MPFYTVWSLAKYEFVNHIRRKQERHAGLSIVRVLVD